MFGETVRFDCYSILNHDGASWEWTISPAPQFISSTTVRNPEVIFGTPGSYDVTLTVTDGNGNSDTKTISNMVTVVDDCPPCESFGNMTWATAITLVDFNGIYNATGKTQPYTDYTETLSSDVEQGSSYDLNVNLNTDGNYTVRATAWIDWNQDSDFEDANETYDLGFAVNTPDGITNLSPVSITVPNDAVIGETTMRIAAKYNTAPGLCETDFDGEVEDYALVVSESLGIIENTFDTEPVLYPNPTNGPFAIQLGKTYDHVTATLIDMSGKTVRSFTYSDTDLLEFAVSEASGVYLVRVQSGSQRAVLRLIIK